jgi:hypothetical protein
LRTLIVAAVDITLSFLLLSRHDPGLVPEPSFPPFPLPRPELVISLGLLEAEVAIANAAAAVDVLLLKEDNI